MHLFVPRWVPQNLGTQPRPIFKRHTVDKPYIYALVKTYHTWNILLICLIFLDSEEVCVKLDNSLTGTRYLAFVSLAGISDQLCLQKTSMEGKYDIHR